MGRKWWVLRIAWQLHELVSRESQDTLTQVPRFYLGPVKTLGPQGSAHPTGEGCRTTDSTHLILPVWSLMPFGTCFSSSLAGPRVPVGRPWWAADGSRGSGGEEAAPQELQQLHRGSGATEGRGFTKFPSPPPSGVSVNKEVVRGCRRGLHAEALIPEDTAQAQHSSRSCPPAPRAVRGHSNHPGPPRVTVPVPPSIISAAGLVIDLSGLSCFSCCTLGQSLSWPLQFWLCCTRAPLAPLWSELALWDTMDRGTASKPLGPWNSH